MIIVDVIIVIMKFSRYSGRPPPRWEKCTSTTAELFSRWRGWRVGFLAMLWTEVSRTQETSTSLSENTKMKALLSLTFI